MLITTFRIRVHLREAPGQKRIADRLHGRFSFLAEFGKMTSQKRKGESELRRIRNQMRSMQNSREYIMNWLNYEAQYWVDVGSCCLVERCEGRAPIRMPSPKVANGPHFRSKDSPKHKFGLDRQRLMPCRAVTWRSRRMNWLAVQYSVHIKEGNRLTCCEQWQGVPPIDGRDRQPRRADKLCGCVAVYAPWRPVALPT